ncbi:trna methyltransferase [Phaffia rhodozyma]|uniref:Trna methyltransferase n=1 Tax=Phaffia rhodozyma TaxID=264483 RepID=A0A0F7SVK5_PHARH|nr:trna methyltransferase [Phaffia rhodozyma]
MLLARHSSKVLQHIITKSPALHLNRQVSASGILRAMSESSTIRPRSPMSSPKHHHEKRARLDESSPDPSSISIVLPSSIEDSTSNSISAALPDSQSSSSISKPIPASVRRPQGKGKKANRRNKHLVVDEVLWNDVQLLLTKQVCDEAESQEIDWESPLDVGMEVVVRVGMVGSGGDSLSLYDSPANPSRKWALLTPFALPEELIKVRVIKNSRMHSLAELVEVIERNDKLRLKDGQGVGCKYFGTCGGCQFQNISYETQLDWKRETVRKAFKYFSNTDLSLIPDVLPTIASPKQSGYRTKITPHFRSLPRTIRETILKEKGIPLPSKKRAKAVVPVAGTIEEEVSMNGLAEGEADPVEAISETSEKKEVNGEADGVIVAAGEGSKAEGPAGHGPDGRFFPSCGMVDRNGKPAEGDFEFKIGFDERISKRVMDIEDCPLGTSVLNKQYAIERRKVIDTIHLYSSDATLILRDASDPNSFGPGKTAEDDVHFAVTNYKETIHERVGDFHFTFPSGSFFQNNNSILIPLTDYVKHAIFPPSPQSNPSPYPPPTHLVDTYCGSGLFGITLSPHFKSITGIEIDPKSIEYAERNAKLNGVDGKCVFKAGKSEDIFENVEGLAWEDTAVVIDPPRKGCDQQFLTQLVALHPQTVVYVSCNVHTQARDIGYLLKQDMDGKRYILESLRGFDLFPQTAHVEGVAVLRLR